MLRRPMDRSFTRLTYLLSILIGAAVVLFAFSSVAIVSSTALAGPPDHAKGGGNGGGGGDDGGGTGDASQLGFRYEVAASWQDIFWLGWGGVNDYGEVVVTTDWTDDFVEGWPLYSAPGIGDVDLNQMIAAEIQEGLLNVDAGLYDPNGDLRILVTAEGINNVGQIVGEYSVEEDLVNGEVRWLAYRYTPPSDSDGDGNLDAGSGALEAIISANDAGDEPVTTVFDFNDSGDVVIEGEFLYLDGMGLYDAAQLQTLAGADRFYAYDINNRQGGVVQLAGIFSEEPNAIRYDLDLDAWTAERTWWQPAQDRSVEMRGVAINDHGDVAGTVLVQPQLDYRAFLAESEAVQAIDLGTLGGKQSKVSDLTNDPVEVVGRSAAKKSWEPYLYTDGTLYNLLDLIDDHEQFDRLYPPREINEAGEILCRTATYDDAEQRWINGLILLTPYQTN